MTFDEVRWQLERLRLLNRAIDRVEKKISDLRSKVDGLGARNYDTVRSSSGGYDSYENSVIDYLEKTEIDKIKLIDLQHERFDLEMGLLSVLEETKDQKVSRIIQKYFDATIKKDERW